MKYDKEIYVICLWPKSILYKKDFLPTKQPSMLSWLVILIVLVWLLLASWRPSPERCVSSTFNCRWFTVLYIMSCHLSKTRSDWPPLLQWTPQHHWGSSSYVWGRPALLGYFLSWRISQDFCFSSTLWFLSWGWQIGFLSEDFALFS